MNAPKPTDQVHGRLQRAPDFTGGTLDRFSQVWLRHGLPGLALGILCLIVPSMREFALSSLERAAAVPLAYVGAYLAVFAALVLYAWRRDRQINGASIGWILYLLSVSAWEEWVFRLAVPYYAAARGLDLQMAVLLSSLTFGIAHYFTLRWRWQWCVGVFFGAMGLSRLMGTQFDLLLVIGVHWIVTFLNTSRPPGPR